MNIVTYSFVWNYKKKNLLPDQPAPVHLKVYFDGNNRRLVKTGVEISEQYWDAKKEDVKKHHPNYARLHKKCQDKQKEIEAYEEAVIKQGRDFTPAELDRYISGSQKDPASFIEFFRYEMENDNTIEDDSKRPHNTVLGNLIEYSNGNLTFKDMDYRWAVEFDRWLRTKDLSLNTIQKRHKIISRYYRRAEKYKLVKRGTNPYEDFKAKGIEGTREALTEDELRTLESLNRSGMDPGTQIVLDRFLFSCYTGLRISDSISLLKSEIKEEKDGIVIVKKMEKTDTLTGDSVTLPLRLLFAGKPEKIARHYLKKYPAIKTLFPPMEPQPINRLLKVISQMAQLRKPLHFHIARHTFGTALADITMNPYLIMDLMGHRDIKTSMIYIHKSAERTKRQLSTIQNWW